MKTIRFYNNLRIQLASIISCAAVAMTLYFPGYCLWTTPSDAFGVYQEYYRCSPSELPALTKQIGGVPKSISVLVWMGITAVQIFITFQWRPRIWVGLLQLCIAACCVIFAWLSQLGLLYFPMIKLFNDLS